MRSSSSLTREVCPASPVTRLYTSTRSPMPLQQQQQQQCRYGVGVRGRYGDDGWQAGDDG